MSDWSEKYSKVVAAVRNGKLKRPAEATCQECGKPKAHKHHDDYSLPLDVMYLCNSCHRLRHSRILRWGVSGRKKGQWMFNFSVLPVGGFVYINKPMHVMSAYVNKYKNANLPGSDFKTFTFKHGAIIFRTK